MMKIEFEGETFTLTKPEGYPYVTVKSSPNGLDIVRNSVELCGQTENDPTLVEGPGSLTMHEGTAAMWLQFEVLNFL